MATHHAKLSVLDQTKPVMHQSIYMCFPSSKPDKTAQSLVNGIVQTTKQLPYLTGTITRGNDRGYSVLSWSDNATYSVEKKLADGLLTYAELKAKGMPLHRIDRDLRPDGAVGNPRPGIDLAVFLSSYIVLDGGIVLALSFHHHFVDGLGIGQILEVIAANTAGREPRVKHDPQAIFRRYDDVNEALGYNGTNAAKSGLSSWLSPSAWKQKALKQVPASTLAKMMPKPNMSTQLEPRMFTFKVAALDELRKTFAKQYWVQQPSMVGLITCLLWVVVSAVRSSHAKEPDATMTTTLLLALNSRVAFPKGSYLNSDKFIGNLSGVAPVQQPIKSVAPQTPIDKASTPDHKEICTALATPLKALAGEVKSKSNAGAVTSSYRAVYDTQDARALAMSTFRLPTFPLMLTSYANFEWFFDFGPDVGKYEFGRFATAAREGFDGAAVLLPRNRELKGDDEVIEAFLKLDRADMALVEGHPWLMPFLARPPF